MNKLETNNRSSLDAASPLQMVQTGAEWLTVRTGGLNRYAEGLSRALAAEGVKQRWLVMGTEDLAPSDLVNVHAVASPKDGLITRLRAMRRERTSLDSADLVASHFAIYAYPLRGRLAKMPHVVHFHGPWADESLVEKKLGFNVRLKRHVERAVYGTGDRFITLSQAFAEVLTQRYSVDPQRVRVIPGGVDVDRFQTAMTRQEARRKLGWELDRPTVLCVRRLVHRMGLEQLIEAMVEVRRRRPDVKLMIAGKGPLAPTLADIVQQRGLSESVQLLGFVPDDNLPAAYRAADLSIVPSQSLEGFGLIIPESLAAGTPAMVTPIGGMPEIVRDLDPNLILSGPTVGELQEGLLQAFDGLERLPTAADCQAYARQRFCWSAIGKRVLGVYAEAMEPYA